MRRLLGKVAVVTGGSRGIGRAIAERLAGDGAAVVIGYQARDAAANAVEEACRAVGGEALAVRADLTQLAGVGSLFERTGERFGRLDILVNNAGTVAATPFADTREDVYDAVFAVNAKAVFFAIQHAARRMADGGRIVNVSTINTVLAAPGAAAYIGSKAAVEAFTRVAAKELGLRGITVNAVLPGATNTEMFRDANPPGAVGEMAALSPFNRIGEPGDVADVVAWLVSDDARWVTGQSIRADGGLL